MDVNDRCQQVVEQLAAWGIDGSFEYPEVIVINREDTTFFCGYANMTIGCDAYDDDQNYVGGGNAPWPMAEGTTLQDAAFIAGIVMNVAPAS